MALPNYKSPLYSKQGLWSLFNICAFPPHFWTLLLAFRDISWLTERSNLWDAIGVVSYGLVFAFAESLIVFILSALLGLLISTKWEEARRIALLSTLMFILSLWAMYGQAYFVWNMSPSDQILKLMAQSGHPYRIIFGITSIEVFLTVAVSTILVLRWDKFFHFVQEAIDRISLLTLLYLVLDLFGLVIVVIRNI
ncbi:MAG: hypothetical protein MUO77_08705 [Anaerolineales bacterium]|nr:hypothetical protein [Anaerolineales bacterium]